jgi:hypothetical protein
MNIPLRAQLAEVRREIALRKRVYPRWVKENRMRQGAADEKIALMEAVAQTLLELIAKTEALPLDGDD